MEILSNPVRIAALAAVIAMGGSAASAATTFDLTGSSPDTTSLSFSEDGIGLDVTGFTQFGGIFQTDVTQDATGLGVTRDTLIFPDDPDLDGQVDEFLVFTFDQTVNLFTILFDDFDTNDDADIFVDTGSGFTQIADESTSNPFVFSVGSTGNRISVGADGGNDSFRVREVTVSAVPLPAAGFLMLAGLGGLGIAARRRRKPA